MTAAFILNATPGTYGDAMYRFQAMLLAAGWTCLGSGDGAAAYSAVGNVNTSATIWNTAKAWARMRAPTGTREFILQLGTTTGARIKYSPVNPFTGGSPSATVTPSATEEVLIKGGGSDAVPTYALIWPTQMNTGGCRMQGAAMDVADGFSFYIAISIAGSGSSSYGLFFDKAEGAAPEDLDPYVIGHSVSTTQYLESTLKDTSTASPTAGGHRAFMSVTLNAANFLPVCMCGYTNGAGGVDNTGVGVNSFNGKMDLLPILYLRNDTLVGGSTGKKGYSTLFRWNGVARTMFIDHADTKAWISIGDVSAVWDETTQGLN